MTRGVADVANLVEVGLRPGAQAIDERLKCVRVRPIPCLELAERGLRAALDELGERWSVGTETRAKGLERGSERGGLGDRVARVRRGHDPSVAPCST